MKLATVLVGALLVLGVHGVPTAKQVQSAIDRVQQISNLRRGLEALYAIENGDSSPVKRCPLSHFHGKRSSSNVENDRLANEAIAAFQILMKEGHSLRELQDPMVIAAIKRNLVQCEEQKISCDETSPYRTANGTCNNLKNPTWGMAGATQRREVASDYDDDLSDPRTKDINGNPLPNVRKISNAVHAEGKNEIFSPTLTLHAFQFGQFLDHDLIKTPVAGGVESCCSSHTTNDKNQCFPIKIEEADDATFKSDYCMNFVRSSPKFCPKDNDIGHREQTNDLTSWLDGSNIYGSSLEETDKLRDGAFLKTEHGTRLPNNPDQRGCENKNPNFRCGVAGDERVNVIPGLSTYHTLFVLEHNRIAKILQPFYSNNETVFQETRKIIIAILQKITYDEFLPSIMSPIAVNKYKLQTSKKFKYDEDLDATIQNAFGMAYRFGHTWIPRNMEIFDSDFTFVTGSKTEDTYFDPTLTYYSAPNDPAGLNGLAYWLSDNSTETDSFVASAARDKLFYEGNDDGYHGFDLVALNLQRGRDHGIPTYNKFRKFCKMPKAKEWNSGKGGFVDHDEDAIKKLNSVYELTGTVDLFSGGLSERPVEGGSLGPTFECIIGDQFNKLKFGDRFWYQGQAAGLDKEQQRAIENYSMAAVLCENYDFVTINAPNAFRADHPRKSCKGIKRLDLDPFNPDKPNKKSTPTGEKGQRTLDILLEQLIEDLEKEDALGNK